LFYRTSESLGDLRVAEGTDHKTTHEKVVTLSGMRSWGGQGLIRKEKRGKITYLKSGKRLSSEKTRTSSPLWEQK